MTPAQAARMHRLNIHPLQAVVFRPAPTPDQQNAARLFWSKFTSKSSMEATR